ncbi:MAG: hypothetical protein AAF494_00265 [Pseudomonadota bacterium]
MGTARIFTIAISATLLAACSNAPNPEDYGGGEMGEIIAKCVARAERKTSEINREQAGELCTCMSKKIARVAKASMSGQNMVMSADAAVRCAKQAGITVD